MSDQDIDAGSCASCDPDDPCFCFPDRLVAAAPSCTVRYSARFVAQYRDLGGDRRFPLRPV